MTNFKNVKEAINFIENSTRIKPKTDLFLMSEALKILKLKFNYKKIHVAGTNGKGSTCAIISNILMAAGYRVATFTSPYLVKFNERIKINMENIEDDILLEAINKVGSLNSLLYQKHQNALSFFELITLVAFIIYDDTYLDYAIIEVGLGGMLDATNILDYDLSLITNIGYDHQKQLGNTLEEISFNKLGILKKNNHLISAVSSSLRPYFKKYASSKGAEIVFVDDDEVTIENQIPLAFVYKGARYITSLNGLYQCKNVLLSLEAIKFLLPSLDKNVVDKALLEVKWPGRFECVSKRPLTFIDGAHNIDGIKALIGSLQPFKDKMIIIIFSALSDKSPNELLKELRGVTPNILLSTFKDKRIMDISEVLINNSDLLFFPSFELAYATAKKMITSDGVIIFTGSIHFIGEVKKTIFKSKI